MKTKKILFPIVVLLILLIGCSSKSTKVEVPVEKSTFSVNLEEKCTEFTNLVISSNCYEEIIIEGDYNCKKKNNNWECYKKTSKLIPKPEFICSGTMSHQFADEYNTLLGTVFYGCKDNKYTEFERYFINSATPSIFGNGYDCKLKNGEWECIVDPWPWGLKPEQYN